MKKQYKYLTLNILVLFLIIGCTKDMDLYPRARLPETSFRKTTEHLKLTANSFYSTLPGFNYDDLTSGMHLVTPII